MQDQFVSAIFFYYYYYLIDNNGVFELIYVPSSWTVFSPVGGALAL